MCVTEWAQSISLRHMDGQIPLLIHATQQVLSEIPKEHLYDHPITKRRLMSTKYSSGTREWHNLWVCLSRHSPNDMTSLLIDIICPWLGKLHDHLINELVEAY